MTTRWLSPYRAILSARFRMLLQYRAAALAGLWTQIFFGLVLLMIYEAFYRSTMLRQPMTFAEIVTYVWLGQASGAFGGHSVSSFAGTLDSANVDGTGHYLVGSMGVTGD